MRLSEIRKIGKAKDILETILKDAPKDMFDDLVRTMIDRANDALFIAIHQAKLYRKRRYNDPEGL